jgi:DNA-directed RNA polymerase specialized sigma24 family protein
MVTDEEQRLIEERVVMLHEEHNMSLRKIAADVGWNKNKVQRFLQRRAA